MNRDTFSGLRFHEQDRPWRVQARGVPEVCAGETPLFDRLARLSGYDLTVWRRSRVVLVGAGAASLAGLALVNKPLGSLAIVDGDAVERSNLPRQFFTDRQLFRDKAIALAENLARIARAPTVLDAYPMWFETAVARGYRLDAATAVVCLVDDDACRAAVARYYYTRGVPVVFAAFNDRAEGGYCFIQWSRPGTPCFGDLSPRAVRAPRAARCGVGASIDIVLAIAGLISWAVDAVLGNRPVQWVYRSVSLSGSDPTEGTRPVPLRPDCPICAAAR